MCPIRCLTTLRSAVLVTLLGATTPQVGAQLPDTFTNLRVLPADIGRGDLMAQMRDMTRGLGVRCTHCHVGEEEADLETMDFASDDKEPKRVARAMLRMTARINGELLPASGRPQPDAVGCITCHRGLVRPTTLAEELLQAHGDGGSAALVARYRALRAEHHGGGSYDFRERALIALARRLARDGDLAAAADALALNLKHFPDSGPTWTTLGEVRARAGDPEGAEAAFARAVALDPDNDHARQRLDDLREPSGS